MTSRGTTEGRDGPTWEPVWRHANPSAGARGCRGRGGPGRQHSNPSAAGVQLEESQGGASACSDSAAGRCVTRPPPDKADALDPSNARWTRKQNRIDEGRASLWTRRWGAEARQGRGDAGDGRTAVGLGFHVQSRWGGGSWTGMDGEAAEQASMWHWQPDGVPFIILPPFYRRYSFFWRI
jgi:hypothetical protein